MDILLTNTPAIIGGLAFIKWAGFKQYDWLGRKGKKSIYDWDIWYCHRRFGIFSYMFILLLVHFLTGFFLMNMFLIPPKHFFPIARLLLWFGLGSIGFKEGHADMISWNTIEREKNPVEGRYRWLSVGILCTEAITCFKYRLGTGNLLSNPTPWYIWLPWTLYFLFTVGFWLYLRFKPDHTTKVLKFVRRTSARKRTPTHEKYQ